MLVSIDLENFGEEKSLASIRSLKEYEEKNFRNRAHEINSEMGRLIAAAKIYVLDNFEKVTDWSDLHLDLYHNRGRQRFGKSRMARRGGKVTSDHLRKLLEEVDKETIQVETLTDVVYDWTDGDFSFKINGVDYLWIDGSSAIDIANYIENFEKKQAHNG